ncbi:DNA mismatch repair protein MutS [Halorubellus sp. JP-L1]|uniref:DNA mismatch repair protein MutS n=1 Tax=Halorubellus sp. JP-L1 TaxID=2715753 RepID=UPI00140CC5B0|nr:DNA mismatch repair protein MutS [Halorubellus sp. JP-L1]NHN43131.1 DNA mismatch repair protein MutS [Halorubellus sp. JP-L1]
MESALGPPPEMAQKEAELTPMMSQYFELTDRYDDALVLFQVGDFYEAFCDAARAVSRTCEVTLTKREDNTGRYPMAGVPIDNAESYIERLLDAGYRVAVADQVQDPEETSGVVDRAVTRVVTPGTLTEDELLGGAENNFVAALAEGYGLAVLDVSTGDFYATNPSSPAAVADEIGRFAPAEAIVGPDVAADAFDADCMVSPYDESAFDRETAAERVREYFGDPDEYAMTEAEVRACGALLAYAEYTRGGGAAASGEIPEDPETADERERLGYLNHLTRYDPREYVVLDPTALESLELFERRSVRGVQGATLSGVLDETANALGRRRLQEWLRRPLLDPARIERRHDAVGELKHDVVTREALHDALRDVYDLERLISRVSRGRANARDLRSLQDTLDVVPTLKETLADAESPLLVDIREDLDELADVRELIGDAIRAEPPIEVTEGGVIREGYDDELDELRATERDGKQWIDDLQARERERTGVDSLKVGHNQVHGYYIEVTNPNLDAVPEDYQRRQTLKNSERYYTPALKEREEEIVSAEERADALEYELFRDVRERVGEETERVQGVADRVARLDVLVSFAAVAATFDYCRPTFSGAGIDVEGGRHPVVERTQESFVPNDAQFDREEFLAVVTGPNMSGKSTYMRQVACICVMAQAGSFVPAASADLRVVDRVFTRVGASDDIAGGQSTFMVEMTELADILADATADSLVLLDEVGRGTSTTDGLAIAQAATEYLHDEVEAVTLFATHHHELTAVADDLDGAFNLHFSATETTGEVRFDHEVSRGAATASYGVEVAQAAGVPDSVLARSRELLARSEAVDADVVDVGVDEADAAANPASEHATLDEFAAADTVAVPESVVDRLRSVTVADTTPMDALALLDELKRELDD